MYTHLTHRLFLGALLTVSLAGAAHADGRDIDGDGFDDLFIGIPRRDIVPDIKSGSAAIALGGSAGFSAGTLHTPPAASLQEAGGAVAMGDFNCDTLIDLAVGAPHLDVDGLDEAGGVYLYLALADGSYDLQLLTAGSVGTNPSGAEDHFGKAILAADFDGDGCDELAIGAPRRIRPANGTRTGVVYMLRGGTNGPTLWQLLIQPVTEARYGFSLASADLTGDGQLDVIIGAPTQTVHGEVVGAVHIESVNPSTGMWDPYGAALVPCDSETACSLEAWRWFGWSIAAGSFDNDGYANLAVGAPGNGLPGYDGRVDIFDGDPGGFTAAGSLTPGSAEERFGFALAAGDTNDDGYDDLAVGAPYATLVGGAAESGAVYLYRGGSSGLVANPGQPVLSPADCATWPSALADQQVFGASLALGSFTGGGSLDLAIGATRAKDQGYRAGAVYLFTQQSGAFTGTDAIGISDYGVAPQPGASMGAALSH